MFFNFQIHIINTLKISQICILMLHTCMALYCTLLKKKVGKILGLSRQIFHPPPHRSWFRYFSDFN